MPFDTQQLTYVAFREILKMRSSPIVVWGGAGLSAPAGLPTWPSLRDRLLSAARSQAANYDEPERRRCTGLLQAAESEASLWDAFSHIRKALGPTTYAAAMRNAFQGYATAEPPEMYVQLWQLGIRGFITLNLDRFAGRSFPQAKGTANLQEFKGREARYNADILRGGSAFVANLHGVIDEEKSWVFTREDFDSLLDSPGFVDFVRTILCATTVLFVGVSADDRAAGGHLERLRARGLELRGHYWITHRNDQQTRMWAEHAGLMQILFPIEDGKFTALAEAVADLKRFVPEEAPVLPVVPKVTASGAGSLPSPPRLMGLSAEEIRLLLNREATRILLTDKNSKASEYETFQREYAECIFRARWTSLEPGHNQFFGFLLESSIAAGGFGEVFKGKDKSGKDVAIKILRPEAFRERGMLDGFRRGIRAMDILSNRRVEGVVPYIAQWEIPPAVVMEYIDGANLEQAIQWKQVASWLEILVAVQQLVAIIQNSHSVPERVLHRDIKPANVMLKVSDRTQFGWEVVVLDFDLCWHRDAVGFSVPMASGSFYGYIAPELVGLGGKVATRNALVDSFGVGMTLYYCVTGSHPVFGQQRQADWDKSVHDRTVMKHCAEWHSLPRRVARMIRGMTMDAQAVRWDLSRVAGELSRLLEACRGDRVVSSCELLCEELAARTNGLRDLYVWDEARLCASFELPTGFHARLTAVEMEGRIAVEVGWNNLGDRKFETVKKYIGPRTDECVAHLTKGGFQIKDKSVDSSTCLIKCEIGLKRLAERTRLDKASAALDAAMEVLRMPGWGRH